MSDSYYDVCIVGTELTGLICAAMLAKKNYRVLVVGHGHTKNTYTEDGHHFIRRPWLFSGFETSSPIKKVFAELSLSLEMHNRPKPFDPFYQVVLPERRVSVVAKESLLVRELEREFPGQSDRLMNFYRAVHQQNSALTPILDSAITLPPQGFMETRAYNKLVGSALDDVSDPLQMFKPGDPFRPFVLAPLMFSSGCHMSPYSTLQLVRAVTHLGRGLYHIQGGIDELKQVFIEKVKDNCGDFREKASVDRFVLKRGKIKEMVLRDRREVVGCDVVVCNTDVKRFFKLIPDEDQKQRFHLSIHELQPTHLLYTVNFALREEAIPECLGRHAFLVDDPNGKLEGSNLMLLSLDPADHREPGTRVLSASVRLPVRDVRPTLENVSKHDHAIAERVRRLVPFFDEHLLAQSSAWVAWDKRTRASYVDTNQWVPIYDRPLDNTLDASPIACRTAYKNLLVAGDHLFSGLGFEGAFLGSLNCVKLVNDLISKKTLLR